MTVITFFTKRMIFIKTASWYRDQFWPKYTHKHKIKCRYTRCTYTIVKVNTRQEIWNQNVRHE